MITVLDEELEYWGQLQNVSNIETEFLDFTAASTKPREKLYVILI